MKTTIFIILFLILNSLSVLAQAPPPPPPDPSNGGTNGPVGGNAPVGSGLTIMLVLGAAWAGKKVYQNSQNETSIEQ